MLDRFHLTHRIWAAVLAYWLVFLLAMFTGAWGLMKARDSLQQLHQTRMVPAALLGEMIRYHYDSRMHVLLAFQHNPDGPLHVIHDHALRMHFDVIQKNRKRPPNALLARGWIQVQAVVGAAGCQRWGSREEMSACLVVGRRVMTSRRYA